MSDPKYDFQYCQKLVLFSNDGDKLFLAKRRGEADYDSTFAFIGGKMEITDPDIIAGLKREKDEEIGGGTKVRVYPKSTYNLLYTKKDGRQMIIPHYLAYYIAGDIKLNPAEYSAYRWVDLKKLESFEPKIENIPGAVAWAVQLAATVQKNDFVEI